MPQRKDRKMLREDPVRLRDATLHRITLTRRWMIVGAAGLTAGLAALVSALLPGKSLGAKSSAPPVTTARANTASSPTSPPLPTPASAAQLGVGSAVPQQQQSVAPPPAPPQPAPQSAPAPSAPATSAPAPSAPTQSAPAPAPSGGVVSGGS